MDGTQIKTTEDLAALGTVSGHVSLTIAGNSQVNGSVYGGGESSDVTGVDKNVTVTLTDDTQVENNVFGGGNRGRVEGNARVIIE